MRDASTERDQPAIGCPACGSTNPAGFRFCGHCGTQLATTCPTCGTVSAPGLRFCGVCGSSLAPGATPTVEELEERKVVTVLFADLTASTELAARMDPEDLRAVLKPFFEAMVEEIRRFDGTVEKFIGDAVVAVFGAPAAHEDDPERAVRTALAMHRRLDLLNEQLRDSSGVELAMRIGINTGEVVTATGVDREALVTGEPVNIAARFQALAPPGGTVVGDRTHGDTSHTIEYRPLGEVTVKGIDRPLAAWEVAGEKRGAPAGAVQPGRASMAPLVGRDDELDLLQLLHARTVRQHRPSLVTLLGPAGIGKSRLAYEFTLRVQQGPQGSRVVRGRCLPYGEGLTYWPLAEILKADAGILDSDPPETILDRARSTLEERVSDHERVTGIVSVLLSSIGVPVQPDPLAGAEPAAAKELIGRSWQAYFEASAAQHPMVAVLEDLHWADASLLDLIEFLAAKVNAPLMVLCTARPDLGDRRPHWGGGIRSSSTIELTPLSQRDGEHLFRHLLGGLSAPPEVTRPLLERSEGNPFFAQELLRMLVESRSLVRRDSGWVLERPLPAALPDTVQGVIASRIDMLSPAEKRVLQDAAVVGRIFWQGAVEHLGVPAAGPVRGIPAVGSTLDVLVRKGLLWERDTSVIQGEREFIFNHILTRDVAYASIPRTRRVEAHARALTWIERLTGGREEEFAEILAHHAELAGDRSKTARYSLQAGHRSLRVFAAIEAIKWYDRALEAHEAGAPPDRALPAEILLSRGEAHEQLGRFAMAEADYRRGLAAAKAAQDGPLQARALADLAHVLWLEDRFEEGERILVEALDTARTMGASELLARMLYTAGTLAFGRGGFRKALGMHQEALAVARAAGDRAGEALARHGLCETKWFLGPFDDSLDEGRRADELFRSLGQRPMVYHNLYMVAYNLWVMGRLEEAHAAFRESVEGCREVGNRRDEGFALSGGFIEFSRGDVGRALDSVDAAIHIAAEIHTPRLELAARSIRAGFLAELRDWDQVEMEVARSKRLSDELGGSFYRPRGFAWDGWLALRAGDRQAARSQFERGRAVVPESLLDRVWNLWIELQAYEDVGDADGAQETGRALLDISRDQSPLYTAWGTYGSALAAALRKEWKEASPLAAEALAAARDLGERPLEWRAGRILSLAMAVAGRTWSAEVERVRAEAVVRAIAASVADPALAASFLSRPDIADVLRGSPVTALFADLSAEELEELGEIITEREYLAGDPVFSRGDQGSSMYIVEEGRVRIAVPEGGGQETVLASLGPGEFFGEVALLDGEARSADAVAEIDSRLLEVPREGFLRFVEGHPRVADGLVAVLSERLQQGTKTVRGADHADVPARIAAAIQRLAQAEGRAGALIEVLPVYLRAGAIWWVRPSGQPSLRVPAGIGDHPGQTVVRALGDQALRPHIVHSTSWRTEDDVLVLTYLAVLHGDVEVPSGLEALPAARSELARGTATGPPADIEVDHVIEHALRHLAWLIHDDPVIKRELSTAWRLALDPYEPEPFRSMDDLLAVSPPESSSASPGPDSSPARVP